MGCFLSKSTEENFEGHEFLSRNIWNLLRLKQGSINKNNLQDFGSFKKCTRDTNRSNPPNQRFLSDFPDLIPIEIESEIHNSITSNNNNKYHVPLINKSCQTDPLPESAFDLDLSDKNDIETQTLVRRGHSPWIQHYYDDDDETVRDAITQTDQRLIFLFKSSSLFDERRKNSNNIRSVEVSVQTLIDTSEVGVQVDLGDVYSSNNRTFIKVKQKRLSRRRRPHPEETIEFIETEGSEKKNAHSPSKDSVIPHLDARRKIDYLHGLGEYLTRVDEWATFIKTKNNTNLNNIHTRLTSILLVSWTLGLESEIIDLLKVRLYFRWIVENIRFDGNCQQERDSDIEGLLNTRTGMCFHFATLFEEFCKLGNLPVKSIYGFAKNADFKPDMKFLPGTLPNHAWNAVCLGESWKLIDCSWAILYDDNDELEVVSKEGDNEDERTLVLNEHFFLTDPDEFILTHFPYRNNEDNYSKWQLLLVPITLRQYNNLPVLSSAFFDYNLRMVNTFSTHFVREMVDIMIRSLSPLRYEWKFYSVNDDENNESHRSEVFCYLKDRQRRLGYFQVRAKQIGPYYLKIYGKPENQIYGEDDDSLDHLATIFINVIEVNANLLDWPRIHVPWGLTPSFHKLGLILLYQNEPIIPLTCGTSTKIVLGTLNESIVTIPHMYDVNGNELLIDQCRDIQYCVLLSRKNPIPGYKLESDESSLIPYVQKEETKQRVIFTINSPNKIGNYKLQIYGGQKPSRKGRYHIPLIASFLIEVRDGLSSTQSSSFSTCLSKSSYSRNKLPIK